MLPCLGNEFILWFGNEHSGEHPWTLVSQDYSEGTSQFSPGSETTFDLVSYNDGN